MVTVLMPVFNGEAYLDGAVKSILDQSFREFEFVIVNDGSTDGSSLRLERFQRSDPRIHCYHLSHQGLGHALNAGIKVARGRYIARMDADDSSHPDRLAKQVAFMESHPEVGICGTWVETIGEGKGTIWRYPSDDPTLRSRMLFESSLAHPSVIMRRELFTEKKLGYRFEFSPAEDYDLWVRASAHCQLANLEEVLLLYRLHSAQSTRLGLAPKEDNAARIRLVQLQRLGLDPSTAELELHRSISMWEFQDTKGFLVEADQWLRKLKTANELERVYPGAAFAAVLSERWYGLCKRMAGFGLWTYKIFKESPLAKTVPLSWREWGKFSLKCALQWPSHV